jgi:hypothetical protein
MARVFLDERIPFTAFTVNHMITHPISGEKYVNEHDAQWARRWCRKFKVDHQQMTLRLDNFVDEIANNQHYSNVITAKLFRFFQLFLLERVNKMGGVAVVGGGEQVYKVAKDALGDYTEPFLEMDPGYVSSHEWQKNNVGPHFPLFYMTTPELMLAYLREPLVRAVLENRHYLRHVGNPDMVKAIIYQSIYPDIEVRLKYNGYENVGPMIESLYANRRAQWGSDIYSKYLRVKDLIDELKPESY